MNIKEAIWESNKKGTWKAVPYRATSVVVRFLTNEKVEDETELDLYEINKEKELSKLWASLADEFESSDNSVISVEAYGYLS